MGLILEHKMFPYMLMRGGQARPCQTSQRFTYPLQLLLVSFLSHLCILVVLWRCCWFQGAAVNLEVDPSFMFMNAQVMPTSSSRPLVLSYVNDFTKLFELPLSICEGVLELGSKNKLGISIFTYMLIKYQYIHYKIIIVVQSL